jgi:hypothetical protein
VPNKREVEELQMKEQEGNKVSRTKNRKIGGTGTLNSTSQIPGVT